MAKPWSAREAGLTKVVGMHDATARRIKRPLPCLLRIFLEKEPARPCTVFEHNSTTDTEIMQRKLIRQRNTQSLHLFQMNCMSCPKKEPQTAPPPGLLHRPRPQSGCGPRAEVPANSSVSGPPGLRVGMFDVFSWICSWRAYGVPKREYGIRLLLWRLVWQVGGWELSVDTEFVSIQLRMGHGHESWVVCRCVHHLLPSIPPSLLCSLWHRRWVAESSDWAHRA